MLIRCPECELQVSDKALACPHCGFPMRNDVQRQTRKSNRRKRLPNGFGQITELKGRSLRKPFRVMVTVGKTPEGRFIQKPLKPESHFETYNDAYAALVAYHKNPYDLSPSITFFELYEKWSEEYFRTLKSDSSARTIRCAWAYCSSLYSMRAMDVRARHLKGCMEDGVAVIKGEERKPSPNIKTRMKSLFNLMFDYALEHEIVDKNYARTFDISDDILKEKERATRGHKTFTDKEIELLWQNVNIVPYVDVVLIQCYTGWRPQELGLLRMENINLEAGTMTGGMKTEAGENRLVPIHSRIRDLVMKKYKEALELNSDYLLNCTDTSTHRSSLTLTYDKYRHRFNAIVQRLGLDPEHRSHDPRKHFVTQAKKYGMDEYALKYIVGHKIDDITERVYTEREAEWLKSEIEKIR